MQNMILFQQPITIGDDVADFGKDKSAVILTTMDEFFLHNDQ